MAGMSHFVNNWMSELVGKRQDLIERTVLILIICEIIIDTWNFNASQVK